MCEDDRDIANSVISLPNDAPSKTSFESQLGWFGNRTGTSVDDGERKSNNRLYQWHSHKLGT